MSIGNLPRTLEWIELSSDHPAALRMIDQRMLPFDYTHIDCERVPELVEAIKDLTVRGAPGLGVAGTAAIALYAINEYDGDSVTEFIRYLAPVAEMVANARPTAVNLSGQVKKTVEQIHQWADSGMGMLQMREELSDYVVELMDSDVHTNRLIGLNGVKYFRAIAQRLDRPLRVETHCNAGSLGTVLYGTATSVIYHAFEEGLIEKVWVDETRPIDQGARLTTWEMDQAGVPYTLICDDMAGFVMQQGLVDAVIVGADRICANGDFANKIGTYGLAVLAKYHGVPFFCAAPQSTFDRSLEDGSLITIEQRDPTEVRCMPSGRKWLAVAPQDADVYNPAFDVTGHELVEAFITELS